jgi:hypothetical protein
VSGTSIVLIPTRIEGGVQGGAGHNPDIYRGYLNEGGLYAERIGAHLPGFPDADWQTGSPMKNGVKGAGINFYRTTFNLVSRYNSQGDHAYALKF